MPFLRTLLLSLLVFPLLSLSCSKEKEPPPKEEYPGKAVVKATGGVNFEGSGTAAAFFKTYVYKATPGTSGVVFDGRQEAWLSIDLRAGSKEWDYLKLDIFRYHVTDVPSRLYTGKYLTYDERLTAEEEIDCRLEVVDGPEYWEISAGQIDVEYYDKDHIRGTFVMIMHHMFYDKLEPDPDKVCTLTGSFDTPVLPFPER